ncbi:hypothetical protein GCM10009080_46460 [Cupriavidus pauculus]
MLRGPNAETETEGSQADAEAVVEKRLWPDDIRERIRARLGGFRANRDRLDDGNLRVRMIDGLMS